MSLHKPFGHVWWCNFDSLSQACLDANCLIGIADNTPGLDARTWQRGKYVPRFILPYDENKPVSEDHLRMILHIAEKAKQLAWLPIVTFCWAGQHRSPALCAVLQAHLFGQGLEDAINVVSKHWPDFATKHRHGVYASTLFECYRYIFQ